MNTARPLRDIRLRGGNVVKRRAAIEQEINAAIADLLYDHDFAPVNPSAPPPYDLELGLEDQHLVMELRTVDGPASETVRLPLQPLRPVVKTYFMICESYYAAVEGGQGAKLEAIDAGRRGIHNEGAGILRDMLQDRIRIDHCTARRLFTLVAALHLGGWR